MAEANCLPKCLLQVRRRNIVEVLLQKKRIPGISFGLVRTRCSQAIEHASHVPMKVHSMQLRIEVNLAKREGAAQSGTSLYVPAENSASPRRWAAFG